MRRTVPAVVLAFLIVVCAATAGAQADFSSTITFGDSLTHNDLLGWPFWTALYGDDPMEAAFKMARVSGDKLTSYAVGGSESQHVPLQITAYALQVLANARQPATMISYEIGGNDVLNNVGLLAASPPGKDPRADKVINDLFGRVLEQLVILYIFHPTAKFVVWTVPDVTYTPKRWSLQAPPMGPNVRAHLARVNTMIRSLEAYSQVVVLDTEAIIAKMAVTPPVIRNWTLVAPPRYGRYDAVFADSIHPTAVSNALLANAILDRMNARWGTRYPKYPEGVLAILARIP